MAQIWHHLGRSGGQTLQRPLCDLWKEVLTTHTPQNGL